MGRDTEATEAVILYTDGACLGNPGPGGFAAVVLRGRERTEVTGGCRHTTNNRMEIMAAIAGLESLMERFQVTLYTDSRYLVNGIAQGWAERWRANGWMRSPKAEAVNADLWARLLDLCSRHEVRFEWIRGHAGDPENERCDGLSVQAAHGTDLPDDTGYKSPPTMRRTDQLSFDL